jgi:malonyl-CoA O-methyltransferase
MIDSLDLCRIRCAFDRAASGFDRADFLHGEIRERLLSRLPIVKIEPDWIMDLGAGTGGAAVSLAQAFPASRVVALDFSKAMLAEVNCRLAQRTSLSDASSSEPVAAVCADARNLPISDQSIDLIFSNLLLQHCPDPISVITEARRILRFPGLFTFTTLGRDSLRELRDAWATADCFSHIAPCMDMHDLGDALIQAGFAEPVMYTETLTITYQSLARAIADLRGVGSINATTGRNRGLTGRQTWQRLTVGYEQYRNADGKLPVTLEIIYGLAWSGQPGSGTRLSDGEFEFPIDDSLLFSRK